MGNVELGHINCYTLGLFGSHVKHVKKTPKAQHYIALINFRYIGNIHTLLGLISCSYLSLIIIVEG